VVSVQQGLILEVLWTWISVELRHCRKHYLFWNFKIESTCFQIL